EMVTITASHTVIPEEPTPQGRFWLSDIDQVVRLRHTPTLYIYKPKQNQENKTIVETLKSSLSKILVHYYPIAGRLCYIEGGRLELNLNAKGAVLIEAETEKTIHDYGDFSPSDSTKELVPIIDYNQPIEDIPIFIVQLTKFKNNEGLAIGVAFFHPLSDGLGAIKFINSWAKIARGRNDASEERKKKTSATMLKLSSEQVDKLKKKANEDDVLVMKKEGSRPFSRYEAIGAHIWRSASKAPTKGYIGEITSKPLGYVAQKIRQATELVSDEFIRSQIDVIRSFEHLDDARKLFLNAEGEIAPYFGNPNFHLTSWMSMPIYEADFGWGKPINFGLAYVSSHDRALILLSPEGDGSVHVCLHFQIARLELFNKFFYEDI
ncbi:hydroxycinnamoyl-coenzyme A shikimate/quinate hydroxycinnamoyltransferase, partial [Trifolium pratense]